MSCSYLGSLCRDIGLLILHLSCSIIALNTYSEELIFVYFKIYVGINGSAQDGKVNVDETFRLRLMVTILYSSYFLSR